MDASLQSSSAVTIFSCINRLEYPEPLDCTAPALDLSLRRRHSPSPEGAYLTVKPELPYIETPSSSSVSSPGSQAGSETSEYSLGSEFSAHGGTQISLTPAMTRAKVPRPFKAYPKDPLSMAVNAVTAEAILNKDSAEAYVEFRKRMLSHVQSSHGTTNKNMRRTSQSNNNPHHDDPHYWEKRRKNNEAAKRSRDARRAKEDEIAIRAAFLEQENVKLKYEVAALKNELERLRSLL